MSSPLEEKPIRSEHIFKKELLDLYRDEVELPGGESGIREYTIHPGAVVMVPVCDNGNLVLLRQYRYPPRQVFIELPAGKLDAGESREDAARRELTEETGWRAQDLREISQFFPCIGYSTEKMWLYLATGLAKQPQKLDHDEFIEVFEVPFEEAVNMVLDGRISDMKSMIGILIARTFLDPTGSKDNASQEPFPPEA